MGDTTIPGFDATDLDMIRRGDMLGPKLGQRVYDALSRPGTVKGVDGQVLTAAAEMDDEQKGQPEWLWHDKEAGASTYGRWAAMDSQAPYIRADLVLSAIVPPQSGEGLVLVPATELLAIRDALAVGDLNDAWHHLYTIADPTFCEMEPWRNLEHQAASPTPQADSQGDGWQDISTAPKVVDETVLLRVEHANYAISPNEQKYRWEEIVTAYWTDFNNGGWVWNGLAGSPTHWRPLPAPPDIRKGA